MTSLKEILTEIEKHTGMPRNELEQRVSKKQEELSGLVSIEGAAYLVAKELGVDLLEKTRRRLEMRNIVSGMKSVNVVGRVFRISDIKEFKRSDSSEGKVVNLFLGDGTGYVRIVLWNGQTNLVGEESIKLGDIIQIVNGMAKENIFGDIEISLGKYGSIRPIEGIELPGIEELNKMLFTPNKISIKNITSGISELQGNIVHVFNSNFIFNICPLCGSTVQEKEGTFICADHDKIKPDPALVISCILDDGTGDIRAVFFRNVAEKVSGLDVKELANMEQEKKHELIKNNLLGKELLLLGRVKKNKIFDRLELIVSDFKNLNISERSKELVKEIELKIGG